jgi:phosphoglycolate phosphatase
MQFSAILFDLDGTLLDTIGDIADSMNAVLQRLGLPGHDREVYKQFVGDGMDMLVRRALPEDRRVQEIVNRCLLSMRAEYSSRWRKNTRPYEGIPELLDALRDLQIRMAILSNKPDDFTREMVRILLAHWVFAGVVGARPDVPKKPDPKAALEIARGLTIPPGQILYLGDSGVDMQTARAAGMFPAGALWGLRTTAELEASGAEALISRPLDLVELLSR